MPASEKSNWPFIEKQNHEGKTAIALEDCTIELFNVDRRIWKNVTKADLIAYYHTVHEVILPNIKDLPQSLHFKIY